MDLLQEEDGVLSSKKGFGTSPSVSGRSSRTRHMDTRYWYVHQLQEEHGLIKVHFVRTKDNVSDLGTKNVTTDVYEAHEGKLITSKESVD